MSRSFNGTSDYLQHNAAVVSTQPITLACWCRLDDVSAAHAFMSIGDSAADTKVYIYAQSPNFFANAVAVGGGSTQVSSTTAPVVGVWTHVCAVFNNVGGHAIYINGVYESNTATTAILGTLNTTAVGTRYTAGVRGAFMSGLIADAAIWDTALAVPSETISAGAIWALARGVSPLLIKPSNLRAYWPLIGRDTPELDRKRRYDLMVNGARPQLAAHPVLQRPNWLSRTRRHRALDLVRLKVSGTTLTGVMGTGALGTVIPLLPPQQPGAIVFTRQIG